jgi:hypothetical protein
MLDYKYHYQFFSHLFDEIENSAAVSGSVLDRAGQGYKRV